MKVLSVLLTVTYVVFCNGDNKLTYYWLVHENDFPLGNDATLATCPDAGGESLATVSTQFADRIATEGSGYLRDDSTFLSLSSCVGADNPCQPQDSTYSCFEKGTVPVGSKDNPLAPLVSIATNNVDIGTTGIIQEFVGKQTPNGDTHNGCVRVDDTCSTCDETTQIDFYAYTKSNAQFLENNWAQSETRINFNQQDCDVQQYNA